MMDALPRINSLTLKNFRGFIGEQSLDVDADIVLIQAPNGYGKSSILEALLALLTGHTFDRYKYWMDTLTSRKEGKSCGSAALAFTTNEPREYKREWCLSKKETTSKFPEPEDLPRYNFIDPEFSQASELRFRLCGYFPEYVDFLFDEAASGSTLSDVVIKLPQSIQDLREVIEDKKDENGERLNHKLSKAIFEKDNLSRKIEELEDKDNDEISEDLEKLFQDFLSYYEIFPRRSPDKWPALSWQGIKDNTNSNTSLGERLLEEFSAVDRELSPLAEAKRAIDSVNKKLNSELDSWIEDARRRAEGLTTEGEELREELEQARAKLEAIDAAYPYLDEQIKPFIVWQDNTPHNAPLNLLRNLSDSAYLWGRVPGISDNDPLLKEVRAAFYRIDTAKTSALADELEALWEQWDERRQLSHRIEELTHRLEQFRASAELDTLEKIKAALGSDRRVWRKLAEAWQEDCERLIERRNLEKTKQDYEALNQRIQSVEQASLVLQEITKSPEYVEGLTQTLNYIAKRFSMVEGLFPFQLKSVDRAPESEIRRLEIETQDGRALAHLSTGQKSQLGTAMLVAQNLYLRNYLSHRALLLDDVSVSYDLSNLSREVILWRQLAYGNPRDSDCYRQIFIASHHEDLSNHLLELLAPPPERSLRVLRIIDWDPNKGPTIEQLNYDNSSENEATVTGFRCALKKHEFNFNKPIA